METTERPFFRSIKCLPLDDDHQSEGSLQRQQYGAVNSGRTCVTPLLLSKKLRPVDTPSQEKEADEDFVNEEKLPPSPLTVRTKKEVTVTSSSTIPPTVEPKVYSHEEILSFRDMPLEVRCALDIQGANVYVTKKNLAGSSTSGDGGQPGLKERAEETAYYQVFVKLRTLSGPESIPKIWTVASFPVRSSLTTTPSQVNDASCSFFHSVEPLNIRLEVDGDVTIWAEAVNLSSTNNEFDDDDRNNEKGTIIILNLFGTLYLAPVNPPGDTTTALQNSEFDIHDILGGGEGYIDGAEGDDDDGWIGRGAGGDDEEEEDEYDDDWDLDDNDDYEEEEEDGDDEGFIDFDESTLAALLGGSGGHELAGLLGDDDFEDKEEKENKEQLLQQLSNSGAHLKKMLDEKSKDTVGVENSTTPPSAAPAATDSGVSNGASETVSNQSNNQTRKDKQSRAGAKINKRGKRRRE